MEGGLIITNLQMLRGTKWFSCITRLLRGGNKNQVCLTPKFTAVSIFCVNTYKSFLYLYINRVEPLLVQPFATIYWIYFIYFPKSHNKAPFVLSQMTFLFNQMNPDVWILFPNIHLEKENLSVNGGNSICNIRI